MWHWHRPRRRPEQGETVSRESKEGGSRGAPEIAQELDGVAPDITGDVGPKESAEVHEHEIHDSPPRATSAVAGDEREEQRRADEQEGEGVHGLGLEGGTCRSCRRGNALDLVRLQAGERRLNTAGAQIRTEGEGADIGTDLDLPAQGLRDGENADLARLATIVEQDALTVLHFPRTAFLNAGLEFVDLDDLDDGLHKRLSQRLTVQERTRKLTGQRACG